MGAPAARENAHELLLLGRDEVERLLEGAGLGVHHNAGDQVDPFLFARAA